MPKELKYVETQNLVPNTLDSLTSAGFIDTSNDKRSTVYIRGITAGEGIDISLVDSTYPNGLSYSTGKTIQISSSQTTPAPSTPTYDKIQAYSDPTGTADNYYVLPDDYHYFIFMADGVNYVTIPSGKPNGYRIHIRNSTGQTFSGTTNVNITTGNVYSGYGALLKTISPLNPGQALNIVCDGNNNWYQISL